MINNEINNRWKSLRNFLRNIEVAGSLEAIWWYTWFTFPGPPLLKIPNLPAGMNYNENVIKPENHYLFAWDLKMLATEVILSGKDCILLPNDSLKNCINFHKAINKWKHVGDASTEVTLENAHILDEMYRVEHQQFRYQGHFRDYIPFIRYFKIYNTDAINKVLMSRLGCDSKGIFTASLCLTGLFLNYPTQNYPIVLPDVPMDINANIDLVLNICADTLQNLRETIAKNHKTDDTYIYQYSPLTATPLVICERNNQRVIICPTPFDLQMRLLSGLYYDLCDDSKFQDGYDFCNAFGDSFEEYIGNLLKKTLKDQQIFSENGSSDNRALNRCDWIVDQKKSCMIIECKTKRPAQKAYTNIMDTTVLSEQLNILADAVVQSYKSYNNYKDGVYKNPSYTFSSSKNTSICVVTLENWYLSGKQKDEFDQIVKAKLEEADIPPAITEEVPYIVMSTEEFEEFSYFLKQYDGFELIKRFNQECPQDTVRSIKKFVDKSYAKKYDYVFRDDMLDCFSDEIKPIIKQHWEK